MTSGNVIAGIAAAVALAAIVGCAEPEGDAAIIDPVELHVSAATTLKRAVEELIPEFEAAHPGVTVVGNYAASGVLQKQIEEGAPVDVFLSAGPSQVNALIEQGLVFDEASTTLCGNDVAIIVPVEDPAGIEDPGDLVNAERLSLGNPETAPAGTKAKEWLVNGGLWDTLEPRFVFGENAAQALGYIARGEVDAGLVFASEATDIPDVKIVYRAPSSELTTPVRYVMAPVASSEQTELARGFVEFMLGERAQAALAGWGFRPVEEME
ncbi:MAG: molybdate ABC transporter substrate-binding protein [Coriobacteriia bacterium]